jgi:hypothetical protein
MGEWRYSSIILDLETRWRRIVSSMPLPFYCWGKSTSCYLMYRRLGGPQSWSGWCEEENNFALARNQTSAIQPVAI